MLKPLSRITLVLGVFLLSHCGKKSVLKNDHNGDGKRHWIDGAQIELHLHSSVPDEYKEALGRAVEKQNSVLLNTMIFLNSDTKKTGFEHNPILFTYDDILHDDLNAIYFADTDLPTTDSSTPPDAVTQIWFTNSEIGGGDVIFKKDKMKTEAQVEIVMIHELGHLLGLEHNNQEAEDIMHPIVTTSMLKSPFNSTYCKELSKRYELRDCPF